jgi:hypothetical protein
MTDKARLEHLVPPSAEAPANGTTAADKLPAPLSRDRRAGLILSFQVEAWAMSDPLAANLRVFNGDLLQIASGLQLVIAENLAQALATPGGQKKLDRQLEMYLKVARQVDRFAQIERQMAKDGTEKNSAQE